MQARLLLSHDIFSFEKNPTICDSVVGEASDDTPFVVDDTLYRMEDIPFEVVLGGGEARTRR